MTLYTSATDGQRAMAKTGFAYLLLTLLCALFGAVYERFSHEVYSYWMLYAFAVPLIGGALPFFALAFSPNPAPGVWAGNFYHSGMAALTVGCIMQGVLEIYGTTNRLLSVYWIAGGALTGLGLLCYALEIGRFRRKCRRAGRDT